MSISENPVEDAIAHYASTLLLFEKAGNQSSPHDAIAVLMARDRIHILLRETQPTPAQMLELLSLDQCLSQHGKRIAETLALEQCRVSVNPESEAWWWSFSAPQEIHPWDRLDWLWGSLSVACFTAAISLIADLSSRLLNGGPDTFGAFTISAQSILTLATARSAFTRTGQQAIRRLLERIRLPKYLWQEAGCVLSILLLLAMVGFHSFLPEMADWYRTQGDQAACLHDGFSTAACSRNPLLAEQRYHRALELDPNNTTVHFHLGELYEQLNQLDEAREQYQIAALTGATPASDQSSTWAVIKLSRLYILDGEYAAAISLLQQNIHTAVSDPDVSDPDVSAYVYNNFGWARYAQGRLPDAKAQLNLAITFAEKSQNPIGHSYCLLAQTLEDLGHIDEIGLSWQLCLGYIDVIKPEEEMWVDIARQKALDQWQSSR